MATKVYEITAYVQVRAESLDNAKRAVDISLESAAETLYFDESVTYSNDTGFEFYLDDESCRRINPENGEYIDE